MPGPVCGCPNLYNVSANVSRYFLSILSSTPRAVSTKRDDFTAVHKFPESLSVINSNAATIAFIALETKQSFFHYSAVPSIFSID